MIKLDGRTAIVTGGSRGIGRSCCEQLAQAGARVVVNYRSQADAAEATVAAITAAGGEAIAVAGDVAEKDSCTSLVRQCVDRFGGLDILVNNAGIWNRAPLATMSEQRWNQTVQVNLTGTYQMIQAALPELRRSSCARIVNISSTAGQRGEAFHAHYAATKGAVIALTKSLAVELAADGILTNCVAPGWVDTDMSRAAIEGETGDAIRAGIPLGRVGTPDEIAAPVVFLASGLAGFINGEIVNVNGGAVLCG